MNKEMIIEFCYTDAADEVALGITTRCTVADFDDNRITSDTVFGPHSACNCHPERGEVVEVGLAGNGLSSGDMLMTFKLDDLKSALPEAF